MKNTYKLGLASIVASMALVGCGGGSSTPDSPDSAVKKEVTGQFIDAPVAGLNYACSVSGREDFTTAFGEYTCLEGDTVEFSLGGYILGSVTAAPGIVTPYDIQSDETAAVNVAQLIQTVTTTDADGNLVVPENFTALDNSTVELNATDFDTAIVDDLADLNVTALVGEGQAQDSMDEDILKALIEGKTYYTIGGDNDMALLRLDFNEAEVTITDVTPGVTGVDPMTDTYEIINNKLHMGDGSYGILVEHTADYIVLDRFTSGDVAIDQKTFYVDQADAEHAYWTLYGITQEKLDGKTFYSYEFDDQYNEAIYAEMTFSAGTLTRTEVINGGVPDTFTEAYEIIDGKIRVSVPAMDGDPSEYVWGTLLDETADFWSVKEEGDANQDGTIDWSQTITWNLSKPADYPDFTPNTTTSTTTTTSTDTTTSTSTTPTEPAPTIDSSMFFGKHIEFTGYAGKFDFTSTLEAVGYLGTYYKEDGTTVAMMWSINQANELRIALYNANMIWEDIAIFEFPEGLNSGAVVYFQDLVNNSDTQITISVFN